MDPKFIVNRQGKDFVLYAGLLDQAHREGLKRITTKLIQAPTPENGQMAITWAEVETEKGIFSGLGDATPQNVGKMIVLHLLRMSETRAKARALRDAINVGATALEELGEDEEPAPAQRQQQQNPAQQQQNGAQTQRTAPAKTPLHPSTEEQRAQIAALRQVLVMDPISVQALSYDQAAAMLTDLQRAAGARLATEAQYANLATQASRLHATYGAAVDLPDGQISQAEYVRRILQLRAIEAQHKAKQPVAAGK